MAGNIYPIYNAYAACGRALMHKLDGSIICINDDFKEKIIHELQFEPWDVFYYGGKLFAS